MSINEIKIIHTRKQAERTVLGSVLASPALLDAPELAALQLADFGFAEPVKAGLAKTDEQHPVMERALSEAQRFEPPEGRWRDVTDKHRGSAIAIFEYWKKAREAAHAACDELARGDLAREVTEAVEKLKGGATSEIEQYKKDVDAFIQDARALFLLDCTELEKLWLALCGADEEPNESPDRDAVRAEARAIGAQMRTRLDPILQRHDALKKRGEALVQEDETKARATTILAWRRLSQRAATAITWFSKSPTAASGFSPPTCRR